MLARCHTVPLGWTLVTRRALRQSRGRQSASYRICWEWQTQRNHSPIQAKAFASYTMVRYLFAHQLIMPRCTLLKSGIIPLTIPLKQGGSWQMGPAQWMPSAPRTAASGAQSPRMARLTLEVRKLYPSGRRQNTFPLNQPRLPSARRRRRQLRHVPMSRRSVNTGPIAARGSYAKEASAREMEG